MLDTCQRNVQEMSELLNDLKDYSVLIAGAASLQIEEINIRVFGSELEASFHAITHAAGMRLDLQIDPDLNVVRSDRRKIRQIITNLVTHAQPHVGVDIIRGLRAHPLALIRGQNCLVLRRVGFIQPKRIQVKSLKPDLALASPGGRFLSQAEGCWEHHHEPPKIL
jgi:hypothetical protein